MDLVIRTQDLTRYYRTVRSDPIKAVDSVALELPAGVLAVVSGPSGSGKTTLLSLLAGLDRPNSGTVALFGQNVASLSDAALAQLRRVRIGLVFQDFKLLPGMPCWQNVALPLIPTGMASDECYRRSLEKLSQLGIEDAASRPPEQLSGGQQQRVALARALVNEPDLILADEPTSQVDADSACLVLTALQSLSERGKTVVITTHDPRLAADNATRFCMTDGQLERLA